MNKLQSRIAIWFTKKLFITLFVFILIILIIYSTFNRPISKTKSELILNTNDLPKVPEKILEARESIKTLSYFVEVPVNQEKIQVKVVSAPTLDVWKGDFLFLHGMAFTSKTWEDLKSLQLLAALGHRAVAIDLPGWGESKRLSLETEFNNVAFLYNLIQTLNLTKPVLISPSMSGAYSIPYMMFPVSATCSDRISGLIAIAPIKTELYEHAAYFRCEVPAMLVLGSEDKKLGLVSLANLRNMPHNEIWMIQKADHAAYMDKPSHWDRLLYYYSNSYKKNLHL